MNKNIKIGNVLLKDGRVATVDQVLEQKSQKNVVGICLYGNVVYIDCSSKNKSMRDAQNWAMEHDGFMASEFTVQFIHMFLDEINAVLGKLGKPQIPESGRFWTPGKLVIGESKYTRISRVWNFGTCCSEYLISEAPSMDDLGTARTLVVRGE